MEQQQQQQQQQLEVAVQRPGQQQVLRRFRFAAASGAVAYSDVKSELQLEFGPGSLRGDDEVVLLPTAQLQPGNVYVYKMFAGGAAAAELATLAWGLPYVPVMVVSAITLAMGLWQLQRQGWTVPREDVPWTLAGVWGVLSAMKDAVKLEFPYRCVVTLPMWVAGRLRAFFQGEGGAASVGVVEVILMMIYVSIVVAILVAGMVYGRGRGVRDMQLGGRGGEQRSGRRQGAGVVRRQRVNGGGWWQQGGSTWRRQGRSQASCLAWPPAPAPAPE